MAKAKKRSKLVPDPEPIQPKITKIHNEKLLTRKKQIHFPRTNFNVNNSTEGKHLYEEIARMTDNKEPITATIPVEYTDPKVGPQAEHNIRTDKWDIAQDNMHRATTARQEWLRKSAAEAAQGAESGGGTEE